eukprot:1652366-Rhodomonas_salina.1
MEQQGILEISQDRSWPRHQMRQPVAKIQQILAEAHYEGAPVYMVFIDWFNAFCSIDIARLIMMFE